VRPFFSTFPYGAPGFGLLLLRFAIGVSEIIRGIDCIRSHSPLAGAVELASGVLLLIGFLTPIAAILVDLRAAAFAYGKFSVLSAGVIEASWTNISVALIATALALLGPGSISVDALLFGRRKIVIPRRNP
jgi:uncharacterized membrane protein YphA (DoxX/SURF4 family)